MSSRKSLFRRRAAGPATGDDPLGRRSPDKRPGRGEAVAEWGTLRAVGGRGAGLRRLPPGPAGERPHLERRGRAHQRLYRRGDRRPALLTASIQTTPWPPACPPHQLSVAEATGQVEDEGWRVRKDGSRFWANVVITALRDASGNLRGFLKITHDLTERRQAEEDLRAERGAFSPAGPGRARIRRLYATPARHCLDQGLARTLCVRQRRRHEGLPPHTGRPMKKTMTIFSRRRRLLSSNDMMEGTGERDEGAGDRDVGTRGWDCSSLHRQQVPYPGTGRKSGSGRRHGD